MKRVPSAGTVSELLWCSILKAEVDFVSDLVVLYVPEDENTDMDGAIEYASVLNANVVGVVVVSGKRLDVEYRKVGGKWVAKDWSRKEIVWSGVRNA